MSGLSLRKRNGAIHEMFICRQGKESPWYVPLYYFLYRGYRVVGDRQEVECGRMPACLGRDVGTVPLSERIHLSDKRGGKRLAARAASDLLEGKCLPPSPRIQNLARE